MQAVKNTAEKGLCLIQLVQNLLELMIFQLQSASRSYIRVD